MPERSLFYYLDQWWQHRRQPDPAETSHDPRPARRWLPTPGNAIFTLALVFILLWAQTVGALNLGAPAVGTSTSTIAYQGRLADSEGAPLTETLNVSFRLYTQANGGIALWTEQWTGSNGVQVSDGLFNVMLGSLDPIPQNIITGNDTLFLGITVGTDDEMSPRVQLGTVPFAVQALTVPDGSVTTGKLADGAVTQEKLGFSMTLPDGSVTTSKLANGAVTQEKLGFTVSSTRIQSGRVTRDFNTPGWTLHQGSGSRSFTVSVVYSQPFERLPSVVVSLSHTDSEPNSNDRLRVEAINVTTTGFDLVISTWSSTQVAGATASWIAYTSP